MRPRPNRTVWALDEAALFLAGLVFRVLWRVQRHGDAIWPAGRFLSDPRAI